MKLAFTKMHGIGNDFIVVDCRTKKIPPALMTAKVMASISDRRFGIGFDQALILKKSRSADFKMEIYNSDGGCVEMCGNGIRCLAAYIWSRRLSGKAVLEIETLAGTVRPERSGDLVRVDMGEPVLEGRSIPVRADGVVKNRVIKAQGRSFKVTAVSMGNPHAVVVVKNVDKFDVEKYGSSLEKNAFFPQRVNVEFIEVLSKSRIKMRVWERGAGETLACGTGACASVVAANMLGLVGQKVRVDLRGGRLDIELSKEGRVYMTGPAAEVFTGVINI
jgi:diaminopimelate epimerase